MMVSSWRIVGAIVTCIFLATGAAHAQVTLNYTGNNFTFANTTGDTAPPDPHTTSDRVTVEIMLAAQLPPNLNNASINPLALTIRDGVGELTLANDVPTYRQILFSTDARGNITGWSIILSDYQGGPGDLSSSIETNYFTNASNVRLEYDRGVQTLCGPTSPAGLCANFGTPNYSTGGIVSQNPGVWTGVVPLPDDPPTANAGNDLTIRMLGETVTLDGSGSFDDNTASGDLQYAWQLTSVPPGSAASLTGADTATPTFVADLSGTFVAQLIVTDNIGQPSDPDEVIVSSANLAPTAAAGPDQIVPVGAMVDLDGSASSDPEGDFLSYSWIFSSKPAGSSAVLFNSSLANPYFLADAEGAYIASLTVTDALGSGEPDAVEIMAIDPADFALGKIMQASSAIEALDPGQLAAPGHKAALQAQLSFATRKIQSGEEAEALTKLYHALERIDGCSLRGEPDLNGDEARDWIIDCAAQQEVYELLSQAAAAIG